MRLLDNHDLGEDPGGLTNGRFGKASIGKPPNHRFYQPFGFRSDGFNSLAVGKTAYPTIPES
jgi:hypothetical protein